MWKIIILIGVVLVIVFSLGWLIGQLYAVRHKEYDRKFSYLEMAVKSCEINHVNYRTIKELFHEIRLYEEAGDSWEKEKLDVLWREFHNKFDVMFFKKSV